MKKTVAITGKIKATGRMAIILIKKIKRLRTRIMLWLDEKRIKKEKKNAPKEITIDDLIFVGRKSYVETYKEEAKDLRKILEEMERKDNVRNLQRASEIKSRKEN